MIRNLALGAAALTLVTTLPAPPAAAQDPFAVLGGAVVGGAIGGGLGGAAYGTNLWIFKSRLPLAAKVALNVFTGCAAFVLWPLIAAAIHSNRR